MSDDDSEIYRDLMRFKPDGLSANAWAVKAGVSRTVWSDMRRHGNPSRRTLGKLLTAVGSSLAEFEALRLGPDRWQGGTTSALNLGAIQRSWTPASLPPLPLIASSLAGEWGHSGSQVELIEICPHEQLQRLRRPASLGGDAQAFALTIVGSAMSPRFRPGMRIAVSPRAPVTIGDDVLVRLRGPGGHMSEGAERVLVAQLVRRTAEGFELRQFNPDVTFQLGAGDVDAVLKVAGELI